MFQALQKEPAWLLRAFLIGLDLVRDQNNQTRVVYNHLIQSSFIIAYFLL